jgi:pyruvate dehydrogenase E2 component (dihydrolipoamide acetyltransferase)
MAKLLRMPGISADAEEVVFLEWSVQPGNKIQNGEAIALVETEKANVDIVADQDAILWKSLIEPGKSVNVGTPIAILIELDEKVTDEIEVFKSLGLDFNNISKKENKFESTKPKIQEKEEIKNVDLNFEQTKKLNSERVFASPIARKLAKENNLSVATIVGTGPGQRIVRADVEKLISNGVKSVSNTILNNNNPKEFTDIPHNGMRKAVARTLSTSKREAPHFYLNASCRVDALLELRKAINEDNLVKISINDFIVKAVVKSLVEVPEMNVIWMDDFVRKFKNVDISVAIGSTRGLVTPVIKNANELTLSQISTQIKDFALRANEGRLKQHEIEGGTFSVTNLGMYGIESFSAIINPPQVGILAIGAVVTQPIVLDGEIIKVNIMNVTLSVDHRPVDGVLAAQWLQKFKKLVENPALILAQEI